jgi:hypothetical protein
MNLSDLLSGFVAPERVRRWGFLAVERFAGAHGYEFARRDGNLYGALMLVPAVAAPVPKLRVTLPVVGMSTAEAVEQYGAPVFLVCDTYAHHTVRSGIDLNLQAYAAVAALIEGQPLEVALAHVPNTDSHPGAAAVRRALTALPLYAPA